MSIKVMSKESFKEKFVDSLIEVALEEIIFIEDMESTDDAMEEILDELVENLSVVMECRRGFVSAVPKSDIWREIYRHPKCKRTETNEFLTILEAETESYKSQAYRMAEDMFSTAQQYLTDKNSKSFVEGTLFINYLILRAPKDSPVLASALKTRGNLSFHECFFEQASRDFEMYTEVNKIVKAPNEEIYEVYGRLVICMYMMRKLLNVKKYFRLYKKYKAKLSSDILQTPNFVQIENHINEFVNEIDDIGNVVPFSESHCKGEPYKGFSTSSEIPAASSMCLHHNDGVYTKDDFAKGSIVFIEDPIAQTTNVPLLDCEVCLKQSENQMYACLDCRYKSYCSLNCLERDKAAHVDECVGFDQLTVLVLDASSIFRSFVRISNYLHEKIFNPPTFRKLRNTEEVWNKLLELLNNSPANGLRDLTLIKKEPLYLRLSEMQYSTVVTTAFRLTIFIERKTNLIDKFYKKIRLSNKQKLVLIGSLLMRIHCNILLDSFDFEIARSLKPDHEDPLINPYLNIKKIKEMMQNINRRESAVNDVDSFYGIDLELDIWRRSEHILNYKTINDMTAVSFLTVLRHVKSCDRIHRILSTYKDNIAELYFQYDLTDSIIYGQAASHPTSNSSSKILCGRIADMSDIDRYMFVKKFARLFHVHYAEYFLQMFQRDREVKQVLTSHCPTLSKFKHSCEPNVEVIVLKNGNVIGKCLRKIKKGEQLYVSYKANHMYHAKIERQRFLSRFGVSCACKHCKLKEMEEWTNLRLAINCETCNGVEITPCQVVCPSCNSQYNNLFNKYRTIIYILENEIIMNLSFQKSTERDIYILHLILFSYSRLYFTPQNEFRITIELKMAHFFAVQNFAKQSYDLIMKVRKNILEFYGEKLVWFTFYSEMLDIIKIILFNNLEDKLLLLSNSELDDLCSIGIHIAQGRKCYIEFHEVFDAECANILEDIQVLFKWKQKIICSQFSPLAHFLRKSNPNSLKLNETENSEKNKL